MSDRFDPLPPGVALLLFGLATAYLTFGTLGADDVTYARTAWSARLALMIAAPAIVLYVLETGAPSVWWRAFWSAGMAVYLLHVWWAIARTFGGDFGAVVERQGWVAGTNALATFLWVADVLAAWLIRSPGLAVRTLHFLAWLVVGVSFIVASAVFRTGLSAAFGYVLLTALGAALVARWVQARA